MSDVWTSRTHAGEAVPVAWVRLLSVYGSATRQMDARLAALHGVSLRDYEVLLFLSWAPDHRLRRVDLAECLLLTQGGVTRVLEGLERAGLVGRARSQSDGRVIYAQLTDAGREKLEEAAKTHVEDIRSLFTDHFSKDELATLARLLGRLPGGQVAAAVEPIGGAGAAERQRAGAAAHGRRRQ